MDGKCYLRCKNYVSLCLGFFPRRGVSDVIVQYGVGVQLGEYEEKEDWFRPFSAYNGNDASNRERLRNNIMEAYFSPSTFSSSSCGLSVVASTSTSSSSRGSSIVSSTSLPFSSSSSPSSRIGTIPS